jgi:hypothetical protein
MWDRLPAVQVAARYYSSTQGGLRLTLFSNWFDQKIEWHGLCGISNLLVTNCFFIRTAPDGHVTYGEHIDGGVPANCPVPDAVKLAKQLRSSWAVHRTGTGPSRSMTPSERVWRILSRQRTSPTTGSSAATKSSTLLNYLRKSGTKAFLQNLSLDEAAKVTVVNLPDLGSLDAFSSKSIPFIQEKK